MYRTNIRNKLSQNIYGPLYVLWLVLNLTQIIVFNYKSVIQIMNMCGRKSSYK